MLLIPLILLANTCPPLAPVKAAVFPANFNVELKVEGDAEAAGRTLAQRIADVGGQDLTVAAPLPGRLIIKGFIPGGLKGLEPLLVPGRFSLRWVDETATAAALGTPAKLPADGALPPAPADRTWHGSDATAVLLEPATFADADLAPCSAELKADGVVGQTLHLALTDAAKARFGEETGRRIQQRLAFVVDDRVLMMPIVQEAITGGRVQITQPAEGIDLRVLQALLRSGPLAPTELQVAK
ncbi:MAG: hypothetical protein R3F60_23180 [bacterium]